MKADFEVKFLLDEKKLVTSKHTLEQEWKIFFQVEEEPTNIEVMYLDTKELSLYQDGWTARIRKKEDRKEYEITYKQRFQIKDGDITKALGKVRESEEKDFEAQVDWGFEKMTLSMACKDRVSSKKGNLLEKKKAAINALLKFLPKEIQRDKDKKWGKKQIKKAEQIGPIHCKRYEGIMADMPVDIEIWPLKSQIICEVSFKTREEKIAKAKRLEIMERLQNKGILLPYDGLKTKLCMEEYKA